MENTGIPHNSLKELDLEFEAELDSMERPDYLNPI